MTHIEAGKVATTVAINWQDRATFRLNDDMSIKALTFCDDLYDQNDDIDREDVAQRFDADFILFTSEYPRCLARWWRPLAVKQSINNRPLAVSLCDYTGNMVSPWLEHGIDAVIVDPQHQESGSQLMESGAVLTRISAIIDSDEVYNFLRKNLHRVVFLAGFPPCTDLAVSGARWFADKAKKDPVFQFKAMQVVWQCYDIAKMIGCPYMIENPVSQISTFWRKPDHIFHPYHFTAYCKEDNYTKKTCLWSGQGFIMPTPRIDMSLGDPDNRIHKAPPGPERANFRSATPYGFARAVFEANKEGIRG